VADSAPLTTAHPPIPKTKTLVATLAAAAGATLPATSAEDSHNLLPVWQHNAVSPRHSIVHNTISGASDILTLGEMG